jgi:hypothetical protein
MSIHRPLVFVRSACLLGFLGFACASGPVVVPVRYTASEGPQAIEFEPRPEPSGPVAVNPYTPKRDSEAPHYSWQSATPVKCAADAKPTRLTFSGSVGVFPLLSDAELQQAQAAADAAQASAEQPEADTRASSPDLVVASLRPRFRQCFSHWLEAKTNAEGSVRFALELGCAGNVQAITADAHGVDEPTVMCLFTVVGPAQFDPPANGHATIQVPVVFKNTAATRY